MMIMMVVMVVIMMVVVMMMVMLLPVKRVWNPPLPSRDRDALCGVLQGELVGAWVLIVSTVVIELQ